MCHFSAKLPSSAICASSTGTPAPWRHFNHDRQIHLSWVVETTLGNTRNWRKATASDCLDKAQHVRDSFPIVPHTTTNGPHIPSLWILWVKIVVLFMCSLYYQESTSGMHSSVGVGLSTNMWRRRRRRSITITVILKPGLLPNWSQAVFYLWTSSRTGVFDKLREQ